MTDEQKAAQIANLKRAREIAAQKRADAKAATDAGIEENFPAQEIVPGEAPEPEDAPAVAEPAETTEFDRFLASLDSESRELLGDMELRVIWEAQQKKAEEERRAARRKAASERALQQARISAGLISPASAEELSWRERMAEKVAFTVDMPTLDENGGAGDVGLRVDQTIFLNGWRYTLTRAQFDSMRDIIYRQRQAELDFEGKSRRHWLRRMAGSAMGGIMEVQ